MCKITHQFHLLTILYECLALFLGHSVPVSGVHQTVYVCGPGSAEGKFLFH
jgi:hypothetical protein